MRQPLACARILHPEFIGPQRLKPGAIITFRRTRRGVGLRGGAGASGKTEKGGEGCVFHGACSADCAQARKADATNAPMRAMA
jgi:hypothetical protein